MSENFGLRTEKEENGIKKMYMFKMLLTKGITIPFEQREGTHFF